MSKSIIPFFLAFLMICSVSAGTVLNTQCTKSESFGGQVQGVNNTTAYTIASVSKVFTTHWATVRLGPKYRYATLIHVSDLGAGLFNVHVEGSLYPYFDKTMYQFLIGQLNQLGVKRINYLTFDESLLYSTDIRNNALLAHGNASPNPTDVMKDLRSDTATINTGLAALNAKALALENLTLPKQLVISISDIHFLQKRDFRNTAQTTSYYLYSSELYRNLKEMNRNSNNFAADRIFEKLSGNEEHRDFFLKRLTNIMPDEFTLYNGSGYPVYVGLDKKYNEASCNAVVEMMDDLRNSLKVSGLDIRDVLPVAGKDSVADGDSTVTQIYGNEITSGALIGKTGSVLDTIAFAGLLVTESENTFFQTSYHVDRTPDDRTQAYNNIRFWLANLLKDKKKTDLDSYKPKTFMAFDSGSKLQRVSPPKQYLP